MAEKSMQAGWGKRAWGAAAITGALVLACAAVPAFAQKKVAAPEISTALGSLDAGKPMELNGIRETILPNGLVVLTREVHTAPVVFFDVDYKVGSVDEQVGQTGMSHLMEHMMFKGTKTRGPGVISAELQDNGADFNASTWYDRTEYHEALASDRLELAMQIESDRMVNSVYDEAQHQKEMTVVRSEYEAGENQPSVVLDKAVRLAAYQVHPYRWTTIGFRSDIENFTRDEMYAYYKNFYTPNNAVVVIVGDFDTAKALAMVRKYFGAIKPHPVMEHFITPEPAQEGERRVVVQRAGTVPSIEIVYHIPGFENPDRYAIDVMETVLSGGRTSRFFQDLVQTGLAAGAEAYDYDLQYPDLVEFTATAQPGHTNPELEKALLAEVQRLQTTPITAEELTRALNQAEADYYFGKDSVIQQGRELGEDAMKGDWRFGETYVENLRKVTPADVQRVAQKYLVERNRTVGYFEPIRGAGRGGRPSRPGAAALIERSSLAQSALPQSSMAFYRRPGSSLDQPESNLFSPGLSPFSPELSSFSTVGGSASPLAAETAPAAAAKAEAGVGGASVRPTPHRVVLDNGMTVIVLENHANPTVSISGAMTSAGSATDSPDRRGLAAFTAAQPSRGTEKRSLLDIARTLEGVGATLNVGAGADYLSISGRSLSRDFNTLLDVLSDELRRPSFPADELEKARSQSLAGIEQSRQETGVLASIAFANALFPKGHPYSSPTLDERAAFLKGITRDDLVAFHQAHYGPNSLVLTIVGDVTTDAAVAAVKQYFGDWQKKADLPVPNIPNTPLPTGLKTVFIPVPDKAQVDVLYGYPGQIRRSDPEFYPVTVMDTLFGGGAGLSSRLAVNVRDRMGLVYGIYASDSAGLGAGPFEVQLGSNPANVDKAVAETFRQTTLLHNQGATPDEVARAISYLTGSYAVQLSTNAGVAGQLTIAQVYGLGLDYIQKRNGYYRAVTPAQVNAAAKKYLLPNTGALVLSGTYSGQYAAAK